MYLFWGLGMFVEISFVCGTGPVCKPCIKVNTMTGSRSRSFGAFYFYVCEIDPVCGNQRFVRLARFVGLAQFVSPTNIYTDILKTFTVK